MRGNGDALYGATVNKTKNLGGIIESRREALENDTSDTRSCGGKAIMLEQEWPRRNGIGSNIPGLSRTSGLPQVLNVRRFSRSSSSLAVAGVSLAGTGEDEP